MFMTVIQGINPTDLITGTYTPLPTLTLTTYDIHESFLIHSIS